MAPVKASRMAPTNSEKVRRTTPAASLISRHRPICRPGRPFEQPVNILALLRRAVPEQGWRAPSIPNLSASDLRSLRHIFSFRHYDAEPSAEDTNDPGILQRLFAHGLCVDLDSAQSTLHPLAIDKLVEAGLLYEENRGIKSHFQAQRYNGLIFFSDFFRWESDPDFVLPIGPAGNYLALLTIRRHVESTLDLGCGCGVQSLLAARHSNRVIATDINLRALALTRFNAQLNDIHNIETRHGSYFEPVKDQRFDLIVANLPYVITPEKRLVYRTVDQPGDAGTHERLNEIPAYLKEDGFAQILINWVHEKNQDPSEPIRRTIEGRYVNAWLIHNASKQPLQYARMWLKHGNRSNPRKLEKMEQSWLRWYRGHHIEQIALGAIFLQRRSSQRNWFCSATVNRTLEEQAGKQFLRLFAAQDYLDKIDDPNILLNEAFLPVDLDFAGDEDRPIVYANHGSRFELRIRPSTKAILQTLDGKMTLENPIQVVSHESGKEAVQIRHEVLADMKELLKFGIILPQSFIPLVQPLSSDSNPVRWD